LNFLGSFPLQPIPENDGCDNQDEKEAYIAAVKGLRCEIKSEKSQGKQNNTQKRVWVLHAAASRFL
jgi:hypothetical protein